MTDEDDGCSRCGGCCKGIIMPYSPNEYLLTRGCVALDVGVGIWVPLKCPHLKYNSFYHAEKNPADLKGYYCDIYETRPLLCRNAYIKSHGLSSYRPAGCTRVDL
jgi:Fe-S-cluster containining protein